MLPLFFIQVHILIKSLLLVKKEACNYGISDQCTFIFLTLLLFISFYRKCIYEFPRFNSPITCLAQSPVIDVIAIGTLSGQISIHNIRSDKEILTFTQESKVTCISFRTDEDNHMMATANMYGDIALWDLENRRLFHMMKGAHDGSIMSAHFLNGQPILITGGADNSVKVEIFLFEFLFNILTCCY